jgi:catechol 2,3-dioxygenase-like lactoylglutathione lyase family enzyme
MTDTQERPIVSLGHVVIKTSQLSACVDFYQALGLTRAETNQPQQDIALLQMRGGTDLILIASAHPMASTVQESHVSYGEYEGTLDLLIASGDLEELEAYREAITSPDIQPSDISHDTITGHHYFFVVDPEGRKIAIMTNHANFKVEN